MFVLYFLILPLIYIPLKLLLHFIFTKYKKFSYKDFNAFGFKYDSNSNYFYTSKDAWQKNFGYCYSYDLFAPLFNMIIDTERVKFYYNGRNYLISFWKGQYGIATGGEVGIYVTNELMINKNTLYFPVEDDTFKISFSLYKNDILIGKNTDKHWWLTIFRLGLFSNPRDLTMDINISFPNKEMLDSFLKSFRKHHYSKKYYNINNLDFNFKYRRSHTKKVFTRSFISDFIRQRYNKKNAIIYSNYVADIIGEDDNTNKINNYIPSIFKNKDESKISFISSKE